MASAPPGNAGAPVTAKSDRARALVSSRAADSRQTASVQADRTGEPSGIWPLDSERWQELAARLAAETPDAAKRAADGSSREWRLYTRAPDAPEARRLALRLRAALPAGAQLSVIADTAIPGGYARLAPP
jgi:hypothetical protein